MFFNDKLEELQDECDTLRREALKHTQAVEHLKKMHDVRVEEVRLEVQHESQNTINDLCIKLTAAEKERDMLREALSTNADVSEIRDMVKQLVESSKTNSVLENLSTQIITKLPTITLTTPESAPVTVNVDQVPQDKK